MPGHKRIADPKIWQSEKISACHPDHKAEYMWLKPTADNNGVFEYNVRNIHSDAYAPARPEISIEQLITFLDDFRRHGLLYVWTENNKTYGYWTGSHDEPGRLLPMSQRNNGFYHRNLKAFVWISKIKSFDLDAQETFLAKTRQYIEECRQKPEPVLFDTKESQLPVGDACAHCGKTVGEIIPTAAFQEFRKMRKQIKKPLTDAAVDLIKRDLLALHEQGEEIQLVLDQSIKGGHASVFALRKNGARSGGNGNYNAGPMEFIKPEFGPIREQDPEVGQIVEEFLAGINRGKT